MQTRRLKPANWIVTGIATLAVAILVFEGCSDSGGTGVIPGLKRGSAAGFNVLVITLDTTRADRLGCFGHSLAETPVLDALAAGGVLFADAVTVAPTTLPAHASIFTGLYPPNHGARKNGEYRLSSDQVTLAERLQSSGYETAAFISAFVLDARYGLDQGFDTYDDAVGPSKALSIGDSYNERGAGQVTDTALEWLTTREGDNPFFMWVHYFDPHQPFDPPEPFASRFGARKYDGEIAYVDSQIGRLLSVLKDTGAEERTVVVVVADHGEGLGDHGESSHGFFIYESVMRVPLILSCPKLIGQPRVIEDTLVSVIDIFPTVLDLLGIDAPRVDGASLIREQIAPDRAVYMESLSPYLDYGWSPLFGLRRHNDKYVLAPDPEYYDLRRDAEETSNLDPEPPESVVGSRDSLRAELAALLREWPPVERISEDAQPVDSQTRERLLSLGYLGGASPGPGEGKLDPKEMFETFIRFDRARGLSRAGRFEEALAELDATTARAPGNRAAYAQIARIYAVTGNLPRAEQAVRQNLALGATPQSLTLLAQLLIASGRLGEIEKLANEALALDPKHGLGYVVLGDLAARRNNFGEAKRLYDRALEVDPYRSGPTVQQRTGMLRRRQAGVGTRP